MSAPAPDKRIYVLTCTRDGSTAPERFRVAATDAEHAVQIAKRQGLTVIEFHVEQPVPAAPAQPPDDTFAIAPEHRAARPRAAKPAAQPVTTPPAAPTGVPQRRLLIAGACVVLALVCAAAAAFGLTKLRNRPRPYSMTRTPAAAPTDDTWYADAFSAASPSCVTIRTRMGNGSGFAVKPYLICTNAHVVRADSRRTLTVVQPESGTTASIIGVIHFDPVRDIALIAVDKPFPALPVAPAGPARPGEPLLAIGSPGLDDTTTLENSLSRLLAAKPVAIAQTTMLQLSGAVNPGNSGGPVLGRDGYVHGMVTAKARNKEGIAFAVLPADIRAAMDAVAASTDQDRITADQRHAAAALVYRVAHARSYEFALLREWDSVIDSIPTTSDRVGAALAAARSDMEHRPEVRAFRDRTRDDAIAQDLATLEKDGLAYDITAAVRAFDSAVQDMAMFAVHPRGSPAELRRKVEQHRDAIADATARVCALLHLPPPDWDEPNP